MKNNYSAAEKKFLKQIGFNIKKLRSEKNISQEELAFKAELDRSYIGSVERGERNIAIINLKKIADALEVKMINFFKS